MAKVLEAGEREPPKGRITFEEFLDWCDEDTRAEWVDGEVVFMSPENEGHQGGLLFLLRIVAEFVERRELGRVFFEGMLMRLGPSWSGRVPDLLFLATEHLERLRGTYVDGPADLVVELVSPESRARDRFQKFREYEVAGVGEYWLVDRDSTTAEFYVLQDGRFQPVEPVDGIYRSTVLPGFWMRVEWLWEPPTLDEVRRQWDQADT